MRRFFVGLAGFAVLLVAPVARAQGAFAFIGAAASLPVGDTKNALKSGWLANAGIGCPYKAVDLAVEGYYGSSDAKVGSGSTKLYAALASVGISGMEHKVTPYLVFGAGMLGSKPDGGTSKTKGAYQIEGGLSLKLTEKLSMWGDVRYLAGGSGNEKVTLMPVTVGFTRQLR